MSILQKFDSNIWLTETKLNGFDVRGALIIGDERAVVWDTLSHPNDMEGLLPLIEKKKLFIIYSHADWDHIWGTVGLPYQNACIIGHTTCLERFSTDVPVTLHEKQTVEPGVWDEVQLITPNMAFRQELLLDLGSITMTLHYLPGHTSDSLVAFLPDQRILFMGDTVEMPFPVIPKDCPLLHWIAELQRWEHDPRVQTVIPAHGAIGGREIIEQTITYLQDLLDGYLPVLPERLTEFYRETHQENMHAGQGL